MRMTLEIDLNDIDSLKQARDLLDFHLGQLQGQQGKAKQPSESSASTSEQVQEQESEHLKMLKRFADGLSPKQEKVWDYFLAHPGHAIATDLKAAIPELQPQGAITGVFKATQRWVSMGGQRETSPFVAVDWSKAHGCGIYRGLSQEEIDYLTQ
ncbi:hypothetical protein PCCS19_19250 [Paenibacillus sp. CCS19]|uniref:hypothetical protein n=1 Tax=Paenibacillus sp. CCS19 TaxID=3158387 RepID=UPI0025667694|nr:hypothetical protein [Paenibacillus cellulosilyticus]GMK38871.1 hypothetical protein PCCS19_19250 [Paenibacillus cellulosilyticus]